MKRSVGLIAGAVTVAVGVAAVAAVVARPATPITSAAYDASTPGGAQGKQITLGAPRTVNVKAISGMSAGSHPYLVAPFLSPHTARATASPRRSSVTTLRAAMPQAASASQATSAAITAFPVMSLARQVGLFGPSQSLEPPDTQLAAGPGALLEMVNDTGSVWSKTGTLLEVFDLNKFFKVPGTQSFSDPRVLYDAASGRWFASGFSFDSTITNSQAYLAVSATSDPTGTWVFRTINIPAGSISDQPMTGICDDKVVMSWDRYTGGGATFQGADTLVLQKSDLLGTGSVHSTSFGPDSTEFRIVPAQSLSSTSTCWLTVNKTLTGTAALGVIAVTGTPAGGDVTRTETNVPIAATSLPPPPQQPSGATNVALNNNDDRLLSAVYRDGLLWTSATDACPSATRDCLRLIEVSTTSATPSLLDDEDVASTGSDLYYPAVSLDNSDNLFFSFTQSSSSPTGFPGAFAAVRAASDGSFSTPVTAAAGRASYSDGTNSPRWGDYSAAAPDPAVPGAMWMTAEYATADTAWGTATAEVTAATAPPAPAIAIGAEGGDGALWAQAPQLGAGWHSLGGKIIAAPAVAAPPNPNGTTPATPLFIATASGGALWERGVTAGWQQLGPQKAICLNGPAAVVTGTSTLTVACEGSNRSLWVNTTTLPASGLPTFTSAWKNLGGILANGPAAAPVGGTMTYFVLGTNGKIYTRTNGTGFTASPWACLGRPAAAAEPASSDTLFACQGSNHALWLSANGGAGWTPAVSLGGILSGGPAVAATSHAADLLAEGSDLAVWLRTPISGFTSLGGRVTGGVGGAGLN
jgi:hypothetical protein